MSIFLPTSAMNSPLSEATIVAVGPGASDKDGITSSDAHAWFVIT